MKREGYTLQRWKGEICEVTKILYRERERERERTIRTRMITSCKAKPRKSENSSQKVDENKYS